MGMNHIRLAVTATALVVAFAVAAVFVLNGSDRPSSVRVLTADGRTSQPSPAPSASPAVAPTQAAPVQLSAFVCGSSTVSTKAAGPAALVSAMRTGSHPGYDRFVVEFASGVPGAVTITPQPRPTFVNSPRGDAVTLAGSAGLLVVMHDADAHTSYGGPASLQPNGASIVEVRRLEDFEGYVGLGLGVAKSSCYRAFMLASPTRLVIDVPVA
jgi:hypothetical protein